jgi:hypothetical protein
MALMDVPVGAAMSKMKGDMRRRQRHIIKLVEVDRMGQVDVKIRSSTAYSFFNFGLLYLIVTYFAVIS